MKYYDDVKKFHDKFGLVTPTEFVLIPNDLHEFRVKFFEEETTEYVESFETRDLPTAIDSLLDLVYITCGAALLHGLDSSIFGEQPRSDIVAVATNIYTPELTYHKGPPHFLEIDEHFRLKQSLYDCKIAYRNAYLKGDSTDIANSFHDLYWSCINGAIKMGFYQSRWDLMWDDVQRANMSKERALRADQSKRGSTYDVFKPAGWIGPRSEEQVEMMIQGKA